MRTQFSFGNGLFRVAVFVAFFGCLIAEGISSSQAATTEPFVVSNDAGAPSGYGGNRFAGLPNSTVPVSGAAFAALIYEGDALGFNTSDSRLTEQLEPSLPDDGIALEDSIEILRVDVQQRVFGLDRVKIERKVASKVAPNARPNISPPLLV